MPESFDEQIVFLVYNWDPMASNWGGEYIAGAYATRDKAEAQATALNEAAREAWMRACSPAGRANYFDRARVEPLVVE